MFKNMFILISILSAMSSAHAAFPIPQASNTKQPPLKDSAIRVTQVTIGATQIAIGVPLEAARICVGQTLRGSHRIASSALYHAGQYLGLPRTPQVPAIDKLFSISENIINNNFGLGRAGYNAITGNRESSQEKTINDFEKNIIG